MSRATADEIRALGYAWPISATVTQACSEHDGQIDLVATLAMLERNLAFHKREQDAMYAFASRWNADIDDTTDRRGDVAEAIENHYRAIAAVRTLRDLFDQPAAQRRPRTPTPPPPPPTAEELAARAARIAEITRRNAPLERAAVADVLATYFDGPIDDAMIDRLHTAVNGTPDAGYSNARGGFVRWPSYEGQAWLEELGDDEMPSRTQLAAFIAASRPGFPAVRWHRPAELVGIWIEQAPHGPIRWELAATGEFATTASPISERELWCVNARERALVLQYRDHRSSTRLRIKVVTALRVEVDYLGIDGPVRHILHRADPK